jgi:hypothetical protein
VPSGHDAKRWFAAFPQSAEPEDSASRISGRDFFSEGEDVAQVVALPSTGFDLRRATILTQGNPMK